MASAAAVASSSSDAFDISMPVRSATIVWKFSSDSRRPCMHNRTGKEWQGAPQSANASNAQPLWALTPLVKRLLQRH
jgi:hypothetical protein